MEEYKLHVFLEGDFWNEVSPVVVKEKKGIAKEVLLDKMLKPLEDKVAKHLSGFDLFCMQSQLEDIDILIESEDNLFVYFSKEQREKIKQIFKH